MEKPISKVCPITHNRYGENFDIPEDECEFEFAIMPDIQEKLDRGLCILMEIEDPENLKKTEDEVEQVNANEAVRTGRMAFVSSAMIKQLFGDEHEGIQKGFVNKEIMDQLEIMAQKLSQDTSKDDSIPFEELDND